MTTSPRLSLVRSPQAPGLRAVADVSGFGFPSYLTSALPDRLYTGLDSAERPPSVLHGEPAIDVSEIKTPLEWLADTAADGLNWSAETRRSVGRLEALWLLAEDRFRLLDANVVEPLAHQASLVSHLMASPDLTRVLIADEVGLGKTVEAGLIIQRLIENSPALPRVLYLTEARLVAEVVREFRKLGLRPREWSTAVQEARLSPNDSDPLVVASMHRAVVNAELVGASGPWDVLIVDEAHHLTDWSEDGSDPLHRMRLCRRLVQERLTPGGRVYLLSGTPHQGSEDRFKNVLRLLSGDRDERAAKGKVVYRIKDDISDWDGRPLFPKRRVNPPTEVDAGDAYARWLGDVHELLKPDNPTRAAGWRRAQALQYCASSPQAGVRYLVRLALRSGLTTDSLPLLREAMAALRPYRGGPVDEPVAAVEQKIAHGQEPVDIGEGEVFRDDRAGVRRVLEQGLDLIRNDALGAKMQQVFSWMTESPDEKFVIFAQPVDTVFTLTYRLQRELGSDCVSIIVGEQTPVARQEEMRLFRESAHRRVLVSSRSGGEGINLQVARRLIHFDIPWNPMEMEQRVGRIHRYGSAQTVVVDALVLRGSREKRVLERSRARLGRIASDLDQERIELLFSRTMSLIPLDELAALMAGENFGELTRKDEDRIDQLVTEGYQRWKHADQEFRDRSERLRTLDRGPIQDRDLRSFAVETLGAVPSSDWRRRVMADNGNGSEPTVEEQPADVLDMGSSGGLVYCGRDAGIGLVRDGKPASAPPRRLGLNDRVVSERVREVVGGGDVDARGSVELVKGAGALLVPTEDWMNTLAEADIPKAMASGAVFTAYLTRALDAGATMRELSSELHCWLTSANGSEVVRLSPAAAASVIRLIRTPRAKRVRPSNIPTDILLAAEGTRLAELRRTTPTDPFVAVFPIAAIWIEPTNERANASTASLSPS